MTQKIASFGGSADLLVLADDSLGTITRWDYRGRHHATGPSPSVAAGAQAGVGATASVVGDDTAGTVTITTGTAPAAGVLATLTFAAPWVSTAPFVAALAKTAGGAVLQVYASTTTTALTISVGAVPTASVTYSFDYQAVGSVYTTQPPDLHIHPDTP